MIEDHIVLKLVLHKAVRLCLNFIIFRDLSETLEYKFRFDMFVCFSRFPSLLKQLQRLLILNCYCKSGEAMLPSNQSECLIAYSHVITHAAGFIFHFRKLTATLCLSFLEVENVS